jgi:beta-glucosidase
MKPTESNLATPLRKTFPDTFTWGVATSAFQIEGAADTDGRGASIWDTFCNQAGAIADKSDGKVACDHYHLYKQDIDLIKEIGVDAYRFSISWSRVQALGKGEWNEKGFAFYDRLIDGLLARGLKPYATLYHWDLPQALQDNGGWNKRETCQHFSDYAAEVARRFGDRVVSIATHNEPWVVAILGHESGIFAPGIRDRKIAMQTAHHLLLSHGMALQSMRATGTKAQLGIVLNQSPFYPATPAPEDVAKAKLEDGLLVRWYMDPLLKGQYPADVVKHLGKDAPDITAGDLDIIRAPLDFIGINYYTRQVVSAQPDFNHAANKLPLTDMGWEICPEGLTDLLVRLNRDYPLPPLLITENGAAFPDQINNGEIDDLPRIAYLKQHIAAVQNAIQQGVNVSGYFVWSLFDNFEWASGYEKRFGIVYVDYATQKRYLKNSAKWYKQFLIGK